MQDQRAMQITDTDRLNWIINHRADIDAPVSEHSAWVIYTPEEPLGNGEGCSRDLRKAIDMAIHKNMPTREELVTETAKLANHLFKEPECECDPTKGPCSRCNTLS